MKNTYKIDFTNNTLTISKAFEDAANDPSTPEYKLLQQIRADFPGLMIVRKTRRPSKKANPNKNLTYSNMERYIKALTNTNDLLKEFESVKELAGAQTNSYQYVRGWFLKQFPNYKELPDFNSKQLEVEVISADTTESKKNAA